MTMELLNASGKLIKLDHKVTKEEFIDMNLPKEQFSKMVEMEMLTQLTDHIIKNVEIKSELNDGDVRFTSNVYLFNEKEFNSLLVEVLELEDFQKDKLLKHTMEKLGFK